LSLLAAFALPAADYRDIPTESTQGDVMLADYFARETRRLTTRNAALLGNTTDWPIARNLLFHPLGSLPADGPGSEGLQ